MHATESRPELPDPAPLLAPPLLGSSVLAALACAWAADFSARGWALAAALLVLGGVALYWSRQRLQRSLQQQQQAWQKQSLLQSSQQGATGDDLNRLCQGVLPIWHGQVDMARSHTEAAIIALTSRFSAILLRIEAAVSRSATGT